MSGLVDTFFNVQVMAQYAPKIIEGMGLTILLALVVVTTGLTIGFVLAVLRALRIRVLNAFIVLLYCSSVIFIFICFLSGKILL